MKDYGVENWYKIILLHIKGTLPDFWTKNLKFCKNSGNMPLMLTLYFDRMIHHKIFNIFLNWNFVLIPNLIILETISVGKIVKLKEYYPIYVFNEIRIYTFSWNSLNISHFFQLCVPNIMVYSVESWYKIIVWYIKGALPDFMDQNPIYC